MEIAFRLVVKALRPENYRDRPDIALLLAGHYAETHVIKWAEAEIWNLIENEESPPQERFFLPIEILIADYYVPEPEKIDRLFCDARIRPIFLNHLKNTDSDYQDYLSERLAIKSTLMSKLERDAFLEAMKVFSKAEGKHYVYRDNADAENIYDEISGLVEKNAEIEPLLHNSYFKYRPIKCE